MGGGRTGKNQEGKECQSEQSAFLFDYRRLSKGEALKKRKIKGKVK